MTAPPAPVVINGWSIFAHRLFLDQVEAPIRRVEALQTRDPIGYVRKNDSKRLAAIFKVAFEAIPQDPTRVEYRQGGTRGDAYKHWFRAKFFRQYRLFFRYHVQTRIIVYAWVNDADTKRAYGSGDDAYRVFQRMLGRGNPPNDWAQLLAEARVESERLEKISKRPPDLR